MEELEKMTCRPMKQRKFLGSWYGGRRWVFDPQRGAWIGAMLPPNFLLEEERTSEDEAATSEVRDTAREKDEGGEKGQEKEICSFEEEEVEEGGEREEKRVHIYLCSKNVYLMGKVKSKVQGLLVRVWEARHAAECAAGGTRQQQQQQQQRFTFRRQPHTFPPSQHTYYGYYPPTIPHYLLQVDASLQPPQQQMQQADMQAAQQPQQGQHMQQGFPTYVQPHMYYQQAMYHHMYYTTHSPPTVVQHDPAQAQQQHPQPTNVVGEESSEPQSDSEGEAIMPEPSSASVETSASSAHAEGQPLYRSPRTAPYVLSEYPPPLYMSPHPFSPPPHPAANNNPQEKQSILGTPPPQHVAPMWTQQQQMYMISPHMAYHHPYQLQQPLPPQHVQYSHWQEQPASGLPDKQPRMTDSNVAAASAHVH